MPRVPPDGILEETRKKLIHKRECAAQILKAAMSINSDALAEMEVPESYIETLPKVPCIEKQLLLYSFCYRGQILTYTRPLNMHLLCYRFFAWLMCFPSTLKSLQACKTF